MTIARAREILGDYAAGATDEEVEQLIRQLEVILAEAGGLPHPAERAIFAESA